MWALGLTKDDTSTFVNFIYVYPYENLTCHFAYENGISYAKIFPFHM